MSPDDDDRRVRLVVSPDAQARIAAAAKSLVGRPAAAEVLVLGPSRDACDEFVRDTARLGGARFGTWRATLGRLASALATPALVARARLPATRLSFEAVVARAVHRLDEESALAYFSPVASRPGFPTAAARTLVELRMNSVPARALHAIPEGGRDLATLADQVEREMESAGLAGRSDVFELAIDAARAPDPPRPVGLPLILLDLPVGSTLESALVRALAGRASHVFATAPSGDEGSIARLEAALGATRECLPPLTTVSSLVFLKAHLFEETAPAVRALDGSVQFRSWPGQARESVEIVREVRRQAASGVPFDRMAVILRSPAEYRAHLQEAFRRGDVPAYFARGTLRPDPSGRALLALLACAGDRLSARRFAEYLSLGQVPDPSLPRDPGTNWAQPADELVPIASVGYPTSTREAADASPGSESDDRATAPSSASSETLHAEGSVPAPWRWERLLVDAAVIGGKDRWERRLDGLLSELRVRREELGEEDEARAAQIERRMGDLAQLRSCALPLIERLAALPQRASWGTWLDALRDLTAASLRSPGGVLETLADLQPMAPVGPVGLDEVLMVLSPRLRELHVPATGRRYGAVFIASAEEVRGLCFDVVFVPGLAEKLFPRKILQDPVLLDEARRLLREHTLSMQHDRVATERLALRLAVGAARERLFLSYPRLEVEQARARVPSFYGLEALRAAEGKLPGFDELRARAEPDEGVRLGWPAPARPDDAIDDAEYDLALLAPFLEMDESQAVGTARYLLGTNPHLARALRARGRRWLKRWTGSDGLVDPEPLALEALAAHRLEARSYSPTALQNFAACPYRFFLQAVHRLEPREEIEALEILDPLTRGALFHDVQFELLTALRERSLLPLNPETLETAIRACDEVLDRIADEYAESLAPAIPRVWDDAVTGIRADLREWLRRAAQSRDGWVPHRFELAFGLSGRDRPHADPASVPAPVPIAGGLQLRGSIDLVERRDGGRLRVTDHKTGKARARHGVVIGGGEVLQPVLYALAIEQLLGEPVESGRLYYCTSDGGYEERVVPLDDESRASAAAAGIIIGEALTNGFLPAAPRRDACTWCDYRPICGPFEEERVRHKPQGRLAPLKRLREMP